MERKADGRRGGNSGRDEATIERGEPTITTMNKTMSIALPAELARFVSWQVRSGHYASRSEVVRAALRAWAEWNAWVAGTDVAGEASGTGVVDETGGPHHTGGPPKAASTTQGAGLPFPLLERRHELVRIGAEEGVRDMCVLSTRPPTAAVEAGARLECVELLVKLAPDRTLQDLARASVRMGEVLQCVVLLTSESSLSSRMDKAGGLRKAPRL